MYFLSFLFNSVIFALINFTIVLYILQRFFQAMRTHHKIMGEIVEFNSMVNQSRASLRYIDSKVSEAMKEIKEDIGKELCITDRLTRLSGKMMRLLQRFNTVEENVIESVRMDHKMETVRVETPADINEEVRKVLATIRKNRIPRQKAARISKKNPSFPTRNLASKFSTACAHYRIGRYDRTRAPEVASNATTTSCAKGRQEKPRATLLPEVQLLDDPKYVSDQKKFIGFRAT